MKRFSVLLMLALSYPAFAQGADELDGKHEIGLSLGRSHNLSHSRTDLHSTHVAAEYGYFKSNKQQWLLEADYVRTTYPQQANTFGVLAMLRYHLRARGKLRPFVQAGAGALTTNLNIADISGHFQFQQKVGGGLRYRLSRDTWLSGAVNFYHISNADLHERNRGINALHYDVGLHRTF